VFPNVSALVVGVSIFAKKSAPKQVENVGWERERLYFEPNSFWLPALNKVGPCASTVGMAWVRESEQLGFKLPTLSAAQPRPP